MKMTGLSIKVMNNRLQCVNNRNSQKECRNPHFRKINCVPQKRALLDLYHCYTKRGIAGYEKVGDGISVKPIYQPFLNIGYWLGQNINYQLLAKSN